MQNQDLLRELEKNEKYITFFENFKKEYWIYLENGIKAGRDYFTNFDFFSSFGFFVEAVQAFPTVNSYYQYFYIDNVRQSPNWASGITGLFFTKDFISFFFSRIITSEGKTIFSNFYAIKLEPKITLRKNELLISSDSKIKLKNISKGDEVEKSIKFSFVDSTSENSYLSLREARNDSLLRKIGRYETKSFLLSLEFEYAPTKPFMKPYWVLEHFDEFGFSSRIDFQKSFKQMLLTTIQNIKGNSKVNS
jgi:hypothetical protein